MCVSVRGVRIDPPRSSAPHPSSPPWVGMWREEMVEAVAVRCGANQRTFQIWTSFLSTCVGKELKEHAFFTPKTRVL